MLQALKRNEEVALRRSKLLLYARYIFGFRVFVQCATAPVVICPILLLIQAMYLRVPPRFALEFIFFFHANSMVTLVGDQRPTQGRSSEKN